MRGFKKCIDLGFTAIAVRWLPESGMRAEADCAEGEEAPLGLWIDEDHTVYLNNSLKHTPKQARQILLHELTHAMLDLYHKA